MNHRQKSNRKAGPAAGIAFVLLLALGATLPAAAETITWANTGGGSWNTAGNWNPADVPNEAGEDALVANDGGTYTITLNTSPSLDAVAIQNPLATLNLGAYGLTFLQPAGLSNAGLVQAQSGSGTLSGPIFNLSGGRIQTLNNCNLYLPGPLISNDGTITINANAGTNSSNLFVTGNLALSGTGVLRMTTSGQLNDAELETSAGMILTQQAGHSIRGAGTILGDLINYGTIMADEAAHVLLLNTNPKANHGTMGAAAGSYLDVSGITLTQGPGGQLLADEGTVELMTGATVVGGTLASNGAGRVSMVSGTTTLADVHNTGTFTILPGTVNLRGSLTTNDGTITLNPAGSSSNVFLTFTENTTLGGNGQCVMVAATGSNDANLETAAGITGTNGVGHTIRGSGTISAALTNAGLISGDDPVRSLDLTGNPKTNQAVMQALGAGRLNVIGCAVAQDPGATILADGAVVGLATNASVTGGTLATVNGGVFDASSGTVTLADATLQGEYGIRGGVTTALAGSQLTNQGTITVNSNASGANAVVHAANDVRLQGSGTLRLVIFDLQNDAAITTATGATLTQAAGHSIRGAGQIRGVVANEGLICADDPAWRLELDTSPKTNRGVLRAEANGTMLITGIAVTQEGDGQIVADSALVQLSAADISGGSLATANGGAALVTSSSDLTGVSNLGTLQITGNNTLAVHGAEFANSGRIEVNYLGNAYNSSLTFAEDAILAGAGRVQLRSIDGDADNAAIRTAGSAQLTIGPDQLVHGSGGLFARLTNLGTIRADDPAGGDLECVSDSLVNRATLRAENGGDLVVSSGRVFNLATLAAVDTGRVVASGGTLTNQGDLTSSGGGTLLINSAGRLVNESLITAGAGGRFNVTDGTVQNHGVVRAAAQGTVWIDYGEYWSDGLTEVATGGSFWSDRLAASGHYSGSTLNGGTWQVEAGGTMRLIGCNVQTLNAGAVLIGAGSVIYSNDGTTDALAGLQRIAGNGHLEVRGGRNYDTPGNLTNDFGRLTVGAGCAFNVHGLYTQTGNGEVGQGATRVDGTLSSDNGTLAIQGGTLCGTGTIDDHVNSSGWVAPGASAGTLTITGNYTQAEAATCQIELGGTAPGQSDRLQVNGQATLSGRLIVRSITGYTPQIGDRFTILTCGSRAGEFTLETGCPGVGLVYETYYYADRVEIEILGDASSVDEPEIADGAGSTDDGGQLDGPTDGSLDADASGALPREFALRSRPLGNGTATLQLALPQAAEVELRVFDLSGRLVTTVRHGAEAAGLHVYALQGTTTGAHLPSGVYLAAAEIRTGTRALRCGTRVLVIR